MAKDLLKVVNDPKIPLIELDAGDDSKDGSGTFKSGPNSRSQKETMGTAEPLVKINEVILNNIESLVIDETGLIPKIKIAWTDNDGQISGPNYPKSHPVLSVFIRSSNNKFKPIRCDFLITSIKTSKDPASSTSFGIEYVISGEMYVPKIHHYISKSYSKSSSKEVLKKVSQESDLGFVTNEFSTNDNMTWINTNRSRANFVKEVASHAYLNDNTFFSSFIDKYYHLNFINVAEQLNPKHPIHKTYSENSSSGLFENNQRQAEISSEKFENITQDILLTNHDSAMQGTNYIFEYSLMGDAGRILKSKGYKKKIYYYDSTLTDNKFTDFYMDPIKIKGYENNVEEGLEPSDSPLKEIEVKKWMGVHYGNTHSEWNAAALINDHNNSELNKVKLKAKLSGINFSVTRGSGVGVTIYLPQDEHRESQDHITKKKSNYKLKEAPDYSALVADSILSGRYYISGAKYVYDQDDEFHTEFYLTRVNWQSEKTLLE